MESEIVKDIDLINLSGNSTSASKNYIETGSKIKNHKPNNILLLIDEKDETKVKEEYIVDCLEKLSVDHEKTRTMLEKLKDLIGKKELKDTSNSENYNVFTTSPTLTLNKVAVPIIEEFECQNCMTVVNRENSVKLNDCLHRFCKECVFNIVQSTTNSTLKCPKCISITYTQTEQRELNDLENACGVDRNQNISNQDLELDLEYELVNASDIPKTVDPFNNIYEELYEQQCKILKFLSAINTKESVPDKKIYNEKQHEATTSGASGLSLMEELLQLDDKPVIKNMERFECPVCGNVIEIENGFMIRDCLHFLCTDCLEKVVHFSENVFVRCPYLDDTYQQCVGIIQEREIKALVAENIYAKFLEKSIAPPVSDFSLMKDVLHLDDVAVIENEEVFECPICADEIQVGHGVILKDCLHSICQECLKGLVENCQDAFIRCPHIDVILEPCVGIIQEREIKGIVDVNIYEKFLEKSIRMGESCTKDSFHCKTPNCEGWCINDDPAILLFECPVCHIGNCLKCKDVHTDLTCEEYQKRKTEEEQNDATEQVLKAQIENREIMHCPTCQTMIEKTAGGGGCDFIRCTICKTQVCWATRGPRWGPNGEGDITGGCKCKVNGVRCHPDCLGCH